MPWKEANVMDIRTEFILKSISQNQSFTELCKEYGISTKTGYKWKNRYHQDGVKGLADMSRRPNSCPAQLDENTVCRLIRLKMAHPAWGPAKILCLFERGLAADQVPSLSSVKRILDNSGLVKHTRRRKPEDTGRITNQITVERANQLWTVDFKGWWYSSERERVEPLTVRDAHSRYVLCAQALPNSCSDTVRCCFENLFLKYGLPDAIHSDNGTPFAASNAVLGLSRLSAWWIALGITLNRSRPGKPQDNGGHERMHRDMAAEVECTACGDLVMQQAQLDIWRQTFNEQRPHEALGMRTPAEFYQKSVRQYDGDKFELEYPVNYLFRIVGNQGAIKLYGQLIFITTALRGWHVGLEPIGSQRYFLWFGKLCLGEIDLSQQSFKPLK
jgi:transposase InsO family protein